MNPETKHTKVLPSNYGSVPHLPGSHLSHGDHRCNPGHAKIVLEKPRRGDVIIVEEKLDGSNVGVIRLGSEIIPITRAGYHARTSPFPMHHAFAEWVDSMGRDFWMKVLSKDQDRVVGEWLYHSHGTHYDLTELSDLAPFFAFDYFSDGKRVSRDVSRIWLKQFFLQPATVLVENGQPVVIEKCLAEIDFCTVPRRGGDPSEGLVIRVENNGKFDFMVKYVSPFHKGGQYLPGIGRPKDSRELFNISSWRWQSRKEVA